MVAVTEYNCPAQATEWKGPSYLLQELYRRKVGRGLVHTTHPIFPILRVKNSPYRCIVLAPKFRLTGAAVVEAPIRRASAGWKAVQLVRVLAFHACLGAEPSETSLPQHTSNVDYISLLNHARDHHMNGSSS